MIVYVCDREVFGSGSPLPLRMLGLLIVKQFRVWDIKEVHQNLRLFCFRREGTLRNSFGPFQKRRSGFSHCCHARSVGPTRRKAVSCTRPKRRASW